MAHLNALDDVELARVEDDIRSMETDDTVTADHPAAASVDDESPPRSWPPNTGCDPEDL